MCSRPPGQFWHHIAMHIRVDTIPTPASVRLVDENDFGSFAVVVHGDRDALGAVVDALAAIGTVDAEHAFLRPEGVQALANSTDPDWQARFDKMIDYARSKGWTDDDGRVRAHLEWRTVH